MSWWLQPLFFLSLQRITAFTLYPPVDPGLLASAYNISLSCLQTLNETLPDCDQTLFQMVGSLDNYWWEDDNVTAICAGNCSQAAASWHFDVLNACTDQNIVVNGKLVPADTISGRFVDGLSVACLSSLTEDAWCLTESQTWVGSDVIRPDCSSTSTDQFCLNAGDMSSANQRMANLYPNDVLCSSCFVQMLYTRVTSQFLPDSDHSDYLVDQLQDIGDVCSTKIPDITVRPLPSYDAAPSKTPVLTNSLFTTTTTSFAASPTCTGQIVTSGQHERALGIFRRLVEARQNPATCDTLSTKYGVTTGDLQKITQSDTCAMSGSVCLPAACSLQRVVQSSTCDSVAASISNNITTPQFLLWNPNIMGLCDNPTPGQYICVGPPGGAYSLAPPPLGNAADAGNQQRGGPSGLVTPTTTITTTLNSASAGSKPTATQSGIAADCNNYAQAYKGDNCYDFAMAHGIAPAQLYTWNAVLGSNGADCNTQFQALEYYCVGVSDPATATSTSIKTTTAATAPSPTQSGIAPTCNNFALANKGDNCYDFALAHKITPVQLYAWNLVLGSSGANCNTQFQAGEYYCVGVS